MRHQLLVAAVLSAALLGACGGNRHDLTGNAGPATADAGTLAPHVSFELLPDSVIDSGSIDCAVESVDGGSLVTLRARGATGLRALMGRLRYDPQHWQPGALEPGAAWGPDALCLAAEREPGVLDLGIVVAHLEDKSGIAGSLEICQLGMLPCSAFPKTDTNLATARSASEFDFYDYYSGDEATYAAGTLDRRTGEVVWSPSIDGDYDQNGEVNIADLIPLSVHLGEVSEEYYWPAGSIESQIDGDGNLEINIADVTTISRNYGTAVDAWRFTYTDELVEFSLLGEAPYSDPIGNRATERIRFHCRLDDIGPSPFIFVHALSGGQELGAGGMLRESGLHPPRLYTPGYGLRWDSANSSLTWYFRLFGDGDQNGEVNAMDILRISRHFGEEGPFEPGSEPWYADYDCNGVVEVADFAVLLLNFGMQATDIAGYLFYSTDNPAHLPRKYSYPALEPVGLRSFDGSQQEWGDLQFASGDYVWLRPFVGDPLDPLNTGAPSEVIQIP